MTADRPRRLLDAIGPDGKLLLLKKQGFPPAKLEATWESGIPATRDRVLREAMTDLVSKADGIAAA